MDVQLQSQIGNLLQQARRILIASHIRPDGDAIGSVLGLGLSLLETGKDVTMALQDGVPSNFRFLAGSEKITRRPEGKFDLFITVDSSDLNRIGDILKGQLPDINIDHHISNLNFAKYNLVEPAAASTSSIITDYLSGWSLPMIKESAEALLTGIVTDTIGFRTSNVTPKTLTQAAKLMEYGANLNDLYHKSLVLRSYESALYWGAGLERLQKEDRLVWTSLTLSDRKRVGYPGKDDADLVNMISTIDDCDISIIFVEQKNNQVKVSWRAQAGWDVSKLALSFGGGGHTAAAGAEISGTLEEVQKLVLQSTKELFVNNKNHQYNN